MYKQKEILTSIHVITNKICTKIRESISKKSAKEMVARFT